MYSAGKIKIFVLKSFCPDESIIITDPKQGV